MIDKQKLLQWIEDKKYVLSEPYVNESESLVCRSALKVLAQIKRDIELGILDVNT